MSIPFRERNPVIVGAVSLAVIAVLMLGAFRADSLPIIGGGDTYYAAFSEAGGLAPNNEVRIAGVRVGKVKSVELDGNQVLVKFQLDQDAQFSSASVSIFTPGRCTTRAPASLASASVAPWRLAKAKLGRAGRFADMRVLLPAPVFRRRHRHRRPPLRHQRVGLGRDEQLAVLANLGAELPA